MAKDTGWIRYYRSSFNSKLYFADPFTRWQAWTDLLLLANHKDGVIFKRGNAVNVKRGQVGYSKEELAKRWTWSRGKVLRFLRFLEQQNVGQIVQHKSRITTLITIVNYEKYNQGGTTEYENIVQQTVQQTDNRRYTNKNDKKNTLVKLSEKNEKKESVRGLSAGEALYVGRYGNSLPEVVGNKKDDSGSKGNG